MRLIGYVSAALCAVSVSQFAMAQEPRPLVQPLVQPTMEVHDLFGMEGRQFREGIVGRTASMATVRISRVEIEKGYTTPSHNHADEELVLLLEGSVIASMGDKEFTIKPGELFTIPAYVQHSYRALEDSVTIEVFGPGRAAGGGGGGPMGGGGAMGAGGMAP